MTLKGLILRSFRVISSSTGGQMTPGSHILAGDGGKPVQNPHGQNPSIFYLCWAAGKKERVTLTTPHSPLWTHNMPPATSLNWPATSARNCAPALAKVADLLPLKNSGH